MDNKSIAIQRLTPADAGRIVDCFKRVYGNSYANDTFYDPGALADKMRQQELFCVGASADGTLVGHMAMTAQAADAASAELGNTVVDPRFRGAGVAWRVGEELTAWCRSRGFSGFLHYPTTDHHIMQRQSVKSGFETGLMLGYIPAATDGKVHRQSSGLREAATVVYQPLSPSPALSLYCPREFSDLLGRLAAPTGLRRVWRTPSAATMRASSEWSATHLARRGLRRMMVRYAGRDFDTQLARFMRDCGDTPCLQLDCAMDDAGIDIAADAALRAGFTFCAWLAGLRGTDVLRLQRVRIDATQMRPNLVNPTAQELLLLMQ